MIAKQTTKQGYTLRKFIGDIHLWLGIASGLVLFVVCLTGTIYTFKDEITQFLNRDVYQVVPQAGQQPIPVDKLTAQISKETKSHVTAVTVPIDPQEAWTFAIQPIKTKKEPMGKPRQDRKEGEGGERKGGGHGHNRGTSYLVNPYTGEIQGTTQHASTPFFLFMMQAHRWLLIEGGVGKMIVGIATLIFLIMEISGLVLWAPAKWKQLKKWKMWKPGFTIKTSNWKRFNHDLHNTLGFYSFILLTIMALTGLCWSFEWYRDGVSNLMGAKVFGGRSEKFPGSVVNQQNHKTLGTQDYIKLANEQLPYDGDIRLTLPADEAASAIVYKNKIGFFAPAAADKVVIDQYSGALIKVDRFGDKPLNERIVASIKPLHLGDVYGTFSKILYFIACLIATSLPVTGTIIWINKLKKKAKKKVVKKDISQKDEFKPVANDMRVEL
jgi:uncharacterized iron-regulated membrane protein